MVASTGSMKLRKKLLLGGMILGMYILHQDSWNWGQFEPLWLGFVPVGLTYHVVYSVLAAVMMAVLVRFAWAKHLEGVGPAAGPESESGREPRQ